MKDYYDILNRRKPIEEIGDAFRGQADAIKPMNIGQRREQALMRGLGAGINMGARAADEAKIRELESYSKQLAEQDMQLKLTAGKNQQIKAENENFFLTNRNDLATLNNFLAKGDFEAINIMSPTLIENYKKITGNEIGEYAYSRDGKVYLDNGKGEVRGMYLADIFQGIIPQEEQINFPELLTYNSKSAVQNKMEEMRLKNEQIRAQIENLKAHGDLYKSQNSPEVIQAEINYKNAQANKLNQEALNVGKEFNKDFRKSNIEFLEEAHNDIKSKEKQLGAYTNIGNLITEEFKSTWNRSGSSLISKAQRFLNVSNTDAARRQAQIEMEKEPLYHEIRKIFTGAVSDKDVALFVTTLPDLNNPYEANMDIINKRKAALEEDIFKLKTTKDLIQNSDYSTHFTHTSIQDKVDQMNKERLDKIEEKKLKTSGKIKIDYFGKILDINKDELPNFKGAIVLNE